MAEPEDFVDGAEFTGEDSVNPDNRDLTVSEADALEQITPAGLDEPTEPETVSPPAGDVGEWDAVEQSRVVEIDDDYR